MGVYRHALMRVRRAACGDLPVGLVLVLALVFCAMASATRQYVAIWRTDFTLWEYAVRRAPEKPRTLNNYGVVLAAAGRLEDARLWFERAHTAGHAAHLPPWDHVEGELRARQNLTAVNELIAELAR